MRDRTTPRSSRREGGNAPFRALAPFVLATGFASSALADPPPFLPKHLADVVERARERQRAENPQRDHDAPAEIADVASGELTLHEVLSRLSSPDFAEREAASQLLADVAMWDDRVLSEACANADLCPEARLRVREALFARFAVSPGPAIGIQMHPDRIATGVGIREVMPNYPSARVLRANDIILKIGDVDLRADPTNMRVQEAIASYQPGDTVEMLILRDEREQLMRVELGQFADLNPNTGQRNEMILRQAWTLRSRRLGLDEGSTLAMAPTVSLFDWRRAAQRASLVRRGAGVLAGGEPSLTPGQYPGAVANIDNSRVGRVERVDPRLAPQPRGLDMQKGLDERLTLLENQINDLSQRLSDARTPEHEHAKLKAVLEDLSLQRRQIMIEMVRWADRKD